MGHAEIEQRQGLQDRQSPAAQAGDYTRVGTTFVIISELLCEAVGLRASEHVLDVATGDGNTALSAARRCCEVTAVVW